MRVFGFGIPDRPLTDERNRDPPRALAISRKTTGRLIRNRKFAMVFLLINVAEDFTIQ